MANRRTVPGERDLIESLRLRTASSRTRPRGSGPHFQSTLLGGLKLGMGDDCAILDAPKGHEILITTDFSLESIHFRREWHPPQSIGHRCLARGLSDLAAMGAAPLATFLSLALPLELLRPDRRRPSWRDRFFDGFLALADSFAVPLAGGDTAQSPSHPCPPNPSTGWALADIMLAGSAPRGRALRRAGANPGDRIYVTGHLGGAAAELARLAAHPARFRNLRPGETTAPNPHPHLFPRPRLAVGAWLLQHQRATAAIDLSDGLSTDLDHLCRASGLAATIEAAAIPIHPLARESRETQALDLALNGGEDYELLFTAAALTRIPPRIAGIPITRIGIMRRMSSRTPRILLAEDAGQKRTERPLQPAGWEHYRK